MKKILFLVVLISLVMACDDGDLQIEIIDFDSASIQNCDPISAETANLLFKLNESEALILELPAGAIRNEVSEEANSLTVSGTGTTKVTYRTFSDAVSNAYFCGSIPPTEPTVVEEIVGQGGNVIITTTANEEGTTFQHEIQLLAISFITSQDERITNLSISNFGTVTTTVEEEQ